MHVIKIIPNYSVFDLVWLECVCENYISIKVNVILVESVSISGHLKSKEVNNAIVNFRYWILKPKYWSGKAKVVNLIYRKRFHTVQKPTTKLIKSIEQFKICKILPLSHCTWKMFSNIQHFIETTSKTSKNIQIRPWPFQIDNAVL